METAFIGVLMGLMCAVGGSILWFILDQRFRDQLQNQRKELEKHFQKQTQSIEAEHRQKLKELASELAQERKELQGQTEELEVQAQELERQRRQLEQEHQELQSQLKAQAQLSPEEAQAQVIEDWERYLEQQLGRSIAQHREYLHARQQELAQEILIRAIQGTAVSHTQEHLSAYLPLPEREMVGRIIGRKGKNIQTLQELTGCDISIDREGQQILISAFDPLRRELAQRTLQALIQEARISPQSIERHFHEQQQALEAHYLELGEAIAQKAQVSGLSTPILHLLGQLNYQTSLGQNLRLHALEVSQLAGQIAEQLDCDVAIARRAGLLHDLGKGLPESPNAKTHCERGVDFAREHGESPEVLHAMAAHHFEVRPQTPEAAIVQIADSISAARPGARSQSLEKHTERLQDLEKLALEFQGVERALVLKAGREIRVLVDPDQLNDAQMTKLASDIARKIETELEVKQVKVTVIREFQANDYARS